MPFETRHRLASRYPVRPRCHTSLSGDRFCPAPPTTERIEGLNLVRADTDRAPGSFARGCNPRLQVRSRGGRARKLSHLRERRVSAEGVPGWSTEPTGIESTDQLVRPAVEKHFATTPARYWTKGPLRSEPRPVAC